MTSPVHQPDGKGRPAKGINSVEIGYRVLLAVQLGPSAVALSEVARRAGLSPGAAHNYLTSLVRTGLVEQEDRGRYRLGPSAFALSLASFRQLNGYDILRSEAKALLESTRQSMAVAVWSQGGPVSIYAQRSEIAGGFTFRTGHLPLLGSGAGMLFLSHLSETLTEDLLRRELDAAGDRRSPREVIEATRQHCNEAGYVRYSYAAPVPFSISVPILSSSDQIPFLLTMVVHTEVSPTLEANWVNELRVAASRASLLIDQSGASGPRMSWRLGDPPVLQA